MQRRFSTFIGIDLGGARGKTTALACLSYRPHSNHSTDAVVQWVGPRADAGQPWDDATIIAYLAQIDEPVAVAINAALTVPACVRCTVEACPGKDACEVPAVRWLRDEGMALAQKAQSSCERERAALAQDQPRTTLGSEARSTSRSTTPLPHARPRLEPYVHRATEIVHHYSRGILPRDSLGAGNGPIAARAMHLRRALTTYGFRLHHNLIEVAPRATVHALFGARAARGYKRDADPWHTRAAIVEGLADLHFAPASRLSREEVLRNDHCFEALISAYTGYLWQRDNWRLPDGVFATDGWLWAPPMEHS